MSGVATITIDGPSGSGKGTAAAAVAATTGFHLLDSGALYRIVAFGALQQGVDPDDEQRLVALVARLQIGFSRGPDGVNVAVNGTDVTREIRSEDCAAAASRVARLEAVRLALLATQRSFQRPPGLVADGRDMGTVVFPDAGLKIFLTASATQRAQRRYKQLKDKGFDVTLRALLEEINARDEQDLKRAVSPLVAAADAVVLDSTSLSIEQVHDEIVALAKQRFVLG